MNRKGRAVNGILLLDKPIGLSSNQALMEVKRLYGAKKAGHTGSLDPLASGMLPICFGEATKFSQFLLEADKHYLVEGKLGIRTTTGDAEGEISARRPVHVDQVGLEAVLQRFRGVITQLPSMYSAIKFQGKPLYYYARKQCEVPREVRTVTIKTLDLVHFEAEEFTIVVECSKGTYIRTLVEDIGEALGCGAHVSSLHRTYVEPYRHHAMHSVDTLKEYQENREAILDALLLPIDSALAAWPVLQLPASVAFHIKRGQSVLVPRVPTKGWVRLFSEEDVFLGVGEVLADGKVAPRRLLTT